MVYEVVLRSPDKTQMIESHWENQSLIIDRFDFKFHSHVFEYALGLKPFQLIPPQEDFEGTNWGHSLSEIGAVGNIRVSPSVLNWSTEWLWVFEVHLFSEKWSKNHGTVEGKQREGE